MRRLFKVLTFIFLIADLVVFIPIVAIMYLAVNGGLDLSAAEGNLDLSAFINEQYLTYSIIVTAGVTGLTIIFMILWIIFYNVGYYVNRSTNRGAKKACFIIGIISMAIGVLTAVANFPNYTKGELMLLYIAAGFFGTGLVVFILSFIIRKQDETPLIKQYPRLYMKDEVCFYSYPKDMPKYLSLLMSEGYDTLLVAEAKGEKFFVMLTTSLSPKELKKQYKAGVTLNGPYVADTYNESEFYYKELETKKSEPYKVKKTFRGKCSTIETTTNSNGTKTKKNILKEWDDGAYYEIRVKVSGRYVLTHNGEVMKDIEDRKIIYNSSGEERVIGKEGIFKEDISENGVYSYHPHGYHAVNYTRPYALCYEETKTIGYNNEEFPAVSYCYCTKIKPQDNWENVGSWCNEQEFFLLSRESIYANFFNDGAYYENNVITGRIMQEFKMPSTGEKVNITKPNCMFVAFVHLLDGHYYVIFASHGQSFGHRKHAKYFQKACEEMEALREENKAKKGDVSFLLNHNENDGISWIVRTDDDYIHKNFSYAFAKKLAEESFNYEFPKTLIDYITKPLKDAREIQFVKELIKKSFPFLKY